MPSAPSRPSVPLSVRCRDCVSAGAVISEHLVKSAEKNHFTSFFYVLIPERIFSDAAKFMKIGIPPRFLSWKVCVF